MREPNIASIEVASLRKKNTPLLLIE